MNAGPKLNNHNDPVLIDPRELPTEPAGENPEDAFEKLIGRLTAAPPYGEYNHEKLHAFFEKGFADSDFSKVRVNADIIPMPVQSFVPIQQGIDLFEALGDILGGKVDIDALFQAPAAVTPIVIYGVAFIAEGHRRWLGTYLVNPRAKIPAINYSYDGPSLWRPLRHYQRAIAKMPAIKDGANVFTMDEAEIRSYLERTMAYSFVEALSKHVAKVTDRESAIKYLLRNTKNLKCINKPALSVS